MYLQLGDSERGPIFYVLDSRKVNSKYMGTKISSLGNYRNCSLCTSFGAT